MTQSTREVMQGGGPGIVAFAVWSTRQEYRALSFLTPLSPRAGTGATLRLLTALRLTPLAALTRVASSTCGREKSNFLSMTSSGQHLTPPTPSAWPQPGQNISFVLGPNRIAKPHSRLSGTALGGGHGVGILPPKGVPIPLAILFDHVNYQSALDICGARVQMAGQISALGFARSDTRYSHDNRAVGMDFTLCFPIIETLGL